jgi:hypothetical protein
MNTQDGTIKEKIVEIKTNAGYLPGYGTFDTGFGC